jgi:hypothetical protein
VIEIRYSTRLGNKLFQYALARILASELNLFLPASPIPGFPSTFQTIPGNRFVTPKVVLKGQDVDLQALLQYSSDCHFILDGNFQQSRLYVPWSQELRSKWLVPEVPSGFIGADPDDLVIHIRRTDYLWQGWGLPFSIYQSIIETHASKRLVIVTDDAKDPFLWRFRKYKPLIHSTTAFEDFLYLRSANNIMLSPSSFSWWAAFLSEAQQIFLPIPYSGIWAKDHVEGVNLEMSSDDRYLTIFANESLSLNFVERIHFERLFWRLKLRNNGFRGYLHLLGSSFMKRLSASNHIVE